MTHPRMSMPDGKTGQDILSPARRGWIILFLLLIVVAAIFLTKSPVAESTATTEWYDTYHSRSFLRREATMVPGTPDPYSKYAGHAVAHPQRDPDTLVIIKISRYDPELCPISPTNCFDCSGGYCQSPLANGERWENNYEIALACPQEWPYYTLVEIDGQLWICKDHGGKIVEDRPGVYWVDQLSRTGHYPHGFEMKASVWFPS